MSSVSVNILSTSFESGKGAVFGISNSTEGTRSYVRGLTIGLDVIHGIPCLEHFSQPKRESIITKGRLDSTSSFINHVKVDNCVSDFLNIPSFAWMTSKKLFLSADKSSLINELDELRSLSDGWAGPGSISPNQVAIIEAKDVLLNVILENCLVTPKIRAVADGEVNFFWNTDGYLIDMAFFGEGAYSYYYKNKLNGEEEYDDISIDKGFSAKMLALLSWR